MEYLKYHSFLRSTFIFRPWEQKCVLMEVTLLWWGLGIPGFPRIANLTAYTPNFTAVINIRIENELTLRLTFDGWSSPAFYVV